MTVLLDSLTAVLGTDVYRPRSVCLTHDQILLAIYATGDALAFISCAVIGCTLLWKQVYTMRLSSFGMKLYGAFFVLTGISYLSKGITLVFPIYRLDMLVVIAMATVAVITAIITIKETFSEPKPHAT